MRLSHILPLGLAALAAAACNGHKDLCGKKFSNITMVGSHNSAFVGRDLTHNQYISPTDQLNIGVRFLQARTQSKNGHPQMCHSYCFLLDAGPIEDYLKEVGAWIDKNPNEVVTLLLNNNDELPLHKYDEAFRSSGLEKHAYRPGRRLAKEDWPTLQEFIDTKRRLIVFMNTGADTKAVDYILPQWDYYWETPFGETNPDFPNCNIDRPENGDPKKLMMMVNHFLNIKLPFGDIKLPDQLRAPRTNSFNSIYGQAERCKAQWGVQANVILLDWINVGKAVKTQDYMNGLGWSLFRRMAILRTWGPF